MALRKDIGYFLLTIIVLCKDVEGGKRINGRRKDTPDAEANAVFTVQPTQLTFISTKRPGELKCTAIGVGDIHMMCASQYLPGPSITKTGKTVDGKRQLTVEALITKSVVFIYFTKYTCHCIALLEGSGREVRSSSGEFKIAHMGKNFPQSPIEVSVRAGESATLLCRPPQGVPKVQIYWKKNGARIDDSSSTKYIITSEGSLLVQNVKTEDEGNYTCLAYNDFFTRQTEPARLYVHINGKWSQWGTWGECDAHCGDGSQRRRRQCNNPSPKGRDGRMCEGAATQSSPCTRQCTPVDGRWSDWGSWGDCDLSTCFRYRRRSCSNPPPAGSGQRCLGADREAGNCTIANCLKDHTQPTSGVFGNTSAVSQNIILWVILCTTVAAFAIILVIIVMCLMKKRLRRNNMYEDDSNDMEGGSRNEEKFDNANNGHPVQQDLTKSMPLRHQRSYTAASRTDSVGTTSEKRPMINSNSRPLPHNGDYYMQISPVNNCDRHDYMRIGSGQDSENESGEDKLSHHSSSPESGICNSCDRQSISSGQLTSRSDVEALVWGNITHVGSRLSVADTGLSLTIPEGAIGRNQTEEIFVAALREDKERPALLEKQTLLSSVILCGPQNVTFNKSLIISFDHCASLKLGQWKLSIYSSNNSYDEPAQWERLVTLNQELLHMPVFCQLDATRCHVMVDQLATRYCLVGESMYGSKAVKQLKLAAFAQPFSSSMDSSIRVYVLSDTQEALCSVVQQERKLGAKLMDKPKQISFQDGGHNLCLMIDSISNGWASKMPAQYQEIPFRHVWNAQSNLHCSFAFERIPNHPNSTLSCKIQVYQKSVLSNRQQININGGNLEASFKIMGQKDLSSTVTVNTQSSSGCSSLVTIDNREQQLFKLSTALKKKLANHLDTPRTRGNDWRMLASALSSDRQLNFFASKPSPTEALLDLWEARTNCEEASVTELLDILQAMGRQDAAAVLERDIGNAWV